MKFLKSYDTAWVIVNCGIPLPWTTDNTRSACIKGFMEHCEFDRNTWNRYRREGRYECIQFRFVPVEKGQPND